MFGGFGAPSYGYMPCQGEYVPDPMVASPSPTFSFLKINIFIQ